MSKEIKFRAWDKEAEIWLKEREFVISSLGDVFAVDEEGNIGKVLRVDLVRYTGLTDKAGVEIYEGDIVEAFGTNGVVYFFDNLSWDGGGSLHSGFYCKEWFPYNDLGELSYHHGLYRDCKVLGNRFDNPEILEDTK